MDILQWYDLKHSLKGLKFVTTFKIKILLIINKSRKGTKLRGTKDISYNCMTTIQKKFLGSKAFWLAILMTKHKLGAKPKFIWNSKSCIIHFLNSIQKAQLKKINNMIINNI